MRSLLTGLGALLLIPAAVSAQEENERRGDELRRDFERRKHELEQKFRGEMERLEAEFRKRVEETQRSRGERRGSEGRGPDEGMQRIAGVIEMLVKRVERLEQALKERGGVGPDRRGPEEGFRRGPDEGRGEFRREERRGPDEGRGEFRHEERREHWEGGRRGPDEGHREFRPEEKRGGPDGCRCHGKCGECHPKGDRRPEGDKHEPKRPEKKPDHEQEDQLLLL